MVTGLFRERVSGLCGWGGAPRSLTLASAFGSSLVANGGHDSSDKFGKRWYRRGSWLARRGLGGWENSSDRTSAFLHYFLTAIPRLGFLNPCYDGVGVIDLLFEDVIPNGLGEDLEQHGPPGDDPYVPAMHEHSVLPVSEFLGDPGSAGDQREILQVGATAQERPCEMQLRKKTLLAKHL